MGIPQARERLADPNSAHTLHGRILGVVDFSVLVHVYCCHLDHVSLRELGHLEM